MLKEQIVFEKGSQEAKKFFAGEAKKTITKLEKRIVSLEKDLEKARHKVYD